MRRDASSVARRRRSLLSGALLAVCLIVQPTPARAFTIQSPVTRGCHEEITIEAWRQLRDELPDATAPMRSRGDDDALIADAPFEVPQDLQELGLVTLLFGIRENDIADLATTSLSDLAVVNSDPHAQRQHCLRTTSQDEPEGTEQALEDCQEFIRESLSSAIDALDTNGLPDGSIRDELEVRLAIRGKVTVRVPAFQLRAAHALHALQDSFTHAFRSPDDPTKVRVIVNFSEYAENTLDEAVDGPSHLSDMDRCDDPDPLRTERRRLAIEATAAALRAILDPPNREAKLRAVEEVITKYTSFDESIRCTFDNNWCDAPEREYDAAACICNAAGAAPRGTGGAAAAAALLALLGVTLRRRRWSKLWVGSGVAVLILAASVRTAAAQDDGASGVNAPIEALAGNSSAGMPGKTDRAGAFFGRIAAGGSYDKPGFSGGLGLRYQISQPLMVGFDAEWNPFFAITPGEMRSGVANAYFSLIRRFQLRYQAVNLRTTVSLGGSYLLFDLVGAPAGSFGPYFGLSFLGIEWKLARGFYLTVDPTNLSFPVPHITGVPFGYWQYRFLVGLEFGG